MGGIVKGIGKAVKGVGKVVGKVVSGVAKLGKSIVKGVGKFMGKLGPIGTIALGFIAPYAIGAMASAGGWLGTVGKGIQAVSSAVSAPFKMAGNLAGRAISGLGEAVGGGFSTITDKVAGAIGYNGGSVSSDFTNIIDGVKGNFNDAFGTSFTNTEGTILGENAMQSTSVDFGNASIEAGTGEGAINAGITPGGQQHQMLSAQDAAFGDGTVGQLDPLTQAANQSHQASLLAEQNALGGFDSSFTPKDAVATTYDSTVPNVVEEGGMMSKLLEAGKGLFSGGPEMGVPLSPIEDSGSFIEGVGAGDGSGGPGGRGRSFYAQELTGLDLTEEFAKRSASLLGRTA